MKDKACAGLIALTFMTLPLHPAWSEAETPAELSTIGAMSVGGGVLGLAATPLVLSGELVDNNPLDVSGKTVRHVATSLSATGAGLVYLLEGTGKGLSQLTVNTLETTGVLLEKSGEALQQAAPGAKASYRCPDGTVREKTIPLVVRKEYVQLNDKIQE